MEDDEDITITTTTIIIIINTVIIILSLYNDTLIQHRILCPAETEGKTQLALKYIVVNYSSL